MESGFPQGTHPRSLAHLCPLWSGGLLKAVQLSLKSECSEPTWCLQDSWCRDSQTRPEPGTCDMAAQSGVDITGPEGRGGQVAPGISAAELEGWSDPKRTLETAHRWGETRRDRGSHRRKDC